MTNVNEVHVVKRDGTRAPWDFSKTFRAISWASQDLNFDTDLVFDEEQINSIVYDGIPTNQLQLLLAHMAESVSYKYPEADIIAARLLLQVVRKEINDPFNHGYTGYPHIKDTLHRAEKYGSRRIDKNIVEKFDLDILNAAIDKDRDLDFRYMGISTLVTSYLLRDTRDNSLIEGPQHFFMRIAMGLAHSEPEEKRHDVAIDLYNKYSKLAFLSSTPTNFNSCTVHPQLSSCFITTVESDSLEGIHSTGQELSQYSKFSGGTANDLTPLRSKGSKIAGTGGRSSGVIAFAKIYEACMRAFDQGGNRPGVICMYLESWHQDIVAFLESVDPKGDERTSLRDAHIANWVPDLFMQRVQEEKDWSLFNPKDVPDLHDLYGEEFKVAYEAYENNPDIERNVIPAKTLFKKMLETLFNRKGKGWICFKDEANRRNPSRAYGRIHSSNLCTEIMLINNSEMSSVCNLGSINLANINSPEELVSVVKTGVRAIDNAITNGYVPNVKGQRFNELERPLGLGLMGLTQKVVGDFHIDYESIEYLVANEIIMGIISMTAMDTSADLAQEKGPYKNFEKSSWARGELIVDTAANDIDDDFFKNIDYYLDKHTPEVLKPYLEVYRSFDRDALRTKVKQGMRNATLLAIAPTASIANIAGCTNCTELPNKLVYSKDNNSGKYNIIPEMFVKLRLAGREDLIKTAYSVSQISTIRSAAVRQRWIDQAQSTNVFVYETVKGRDLAKIYISAWTYRLKTTYYLRSQAPDIKNNMDSFVSENESPVEQPVEDASFCSVDDDGCISCQ